MLTHLELFFLFSFVIFALPSERTSAIVTFVFTLVLTTTPLRDHVTIIIPFYQ